MAMKHFSGIHPTAIIGDNVTLGKNVTIGPRAIIYDNVTVGDQANIGADVILGEPLTSIYSDPDAYENPPLMIGERALIRSGTIIYAGSTIGPELETGHRVTIREGATIGRNLRVGTLSDIQGHCTIGDYVRFHSNVHIGQGSEIANYVWIFPYTVLTNDPHPPSLEMRGVVVEEFAVIATMVVVLPGVRVGRDSLVAASSMVRRDVQPETVVAGNPAQPVASVRDIKNKSTGQPVYPWRYSFDRGMPWQGIGFDEWSKGLAPKSE